MPLLFTIRLPELEVVVFISRDVEAVLQFQDDMHSLAYISVRIQQRVGTDRVPPALSFLTSMRDVC